MTQPPFFVFYCKTIFAVCFWQEDSDLDDTVQVNIKNFSSWSVAPGRPIKITVHISTEKITCWSLTKILGWFVAFYFLNSQTLTRAIALDLNHLWPHSMTCPVLQLHYNPAFQQVLTMWNISNWMLAKKILISKTQAQNTDKWKTFLKFPKKEQLLAKNFQVRQKYVRLCINA